MSANLGRTWQDTANLLVQKKAGMYFLGTFAGQQATAQADHDDLDFFPFPTLGTSFDSELGIDAPIDGFMMTAKSPTLAADKDAAMAFLEYLSTGPAQITFLVANPNSVAAGNDADTSGYSAFQKKSAEIIGGVGRHRPVPRPRHGSRLRQADAVVPADLADGPEPGPHQVPGQHPGLLGFARHQLSRIPRSRQPIN